MEVDDAFLASTEKGGEHLDSDYAEHDQECSDLGFEASEVNLLLEDLEAAHPSKENCSTLERYSKRIKTFLHILPCLLFFGLIYGSLIWLVYYMNPELNAREEARRLARAKGAEVAQAAADRLQNAYLRIDQLGSTVELLTSTVENLVERLDQVQGLNQNLTATLGGVI